MTEGPLLSVIVPTYNRPALLRNALESLRHQTLEDFECLVINDGGKGVKVPADSRFRVIDKPNGGYASALNVGLNEARAPCVSFLDDDDTYSPKRLEIGLKGLERAPLTFCWRAKMDTGVGKYARLLDGWVYDVILDRAPPLLAQITVRRDLAPTFNSALLQGSEIDWLLRATRAMPASTVPEVGFLFNHNHPKRLSLELEQRIASRESFYELHKEYFATHRKAAARFHSRIGLFMWGAGDTTRARSNLWKAVTLRPSPRMVFRWTRALMFPKPRMEPTRGLKKSLSRS